jgi:hypothetical protein
MEVPYTHPFGAGLTWMIGCVKIDSQLRPFCHDILPIGDDIQGSNLIPYIPGHL